MLRLGGRPTVRPPPLSAKLKRNKTLFLMSTTFCFWTYLVQIPTEPVSPASEGALQTFHHVKQREKWVFFGGGRKERVRKHQNEREREREHYVGVPTLSLYLENPNYKTINTSLF